MKIAARKPATSVTMPPPTATTRLERSAPRSNHLFGQRLHFRQSLARFAAGKEQHLVRSIAEPSLRRAAARHPRWRQKYLAGALWNVLATLSKRRRAPPESDTSARVFPPRRTAYNRCTMWLSLPLEATLSVKVSMSESDLLRPLLVCRRPRFRNPSPQTILWAAPGILIAAMIIAWAAESAQFFIAQGFALAILAWMQTLPEFAMEAVFAWRQQVPFLFASLTGALRLLTGLGWPMIYCAAAVMYGRREGKPLGRIRSGGRAQRAGDRAAGAAHLHKRDRGWKGSLHLVDAVVLTAIYAAYLAVLGKMPPQEDEGIEDLERIPRAIVLRRALAASQ